jgi:hypothetical protein
MIRADNNKRGIISFPRPGKPRLARMKKLVRRGILYKEVYRNEAIDIKEGYRNEVIYINFKEVY